MTVKIERNRTDLKKLDELGENALKSATLMDLFVNGATLMGANKDVLLGVIRVIITGAAAEVERLQRENQEMQDKNAVLEDALAKINNIAVEWHELGPYESANEYALKKMMEIYELSRGGTTMNNFYEYLGENNEYYALIAAGTKEEANQAYVERVCDVDDGEEPIPTEVTEKQVKQRLSAAVYENGETAETELASASVSKTPYVLLIDSLLS